MVTDKTKDEIAKLAVAPIMRRLSERAYEEVMENFCKVNCGQCPDGRLCSVAKRVHKGFLALLCQNYASYHN